MPSKGIQAYTYNSVPGCQIEISVPGRTVIKSELKQFALDHVEVDKKFIPGVFKFSGVFRCRVTQDGVEIMNKYVKINTLTGNLEEGNMKAMSDQATILTNGLVVNYLFYDADNIGSFGLPRWDQFMVTVGRNMSNWQSTVAVPGSVTAQKPFSCFALPAAHDVGMNSMQNSEAVLNNAATIFLKLLKVSVAPIQEVADKISDQILLALAPNIIQGLAITQKDSLSTMLNCGIRYFEFRPAHLHDAVRSASPIPDVPYFMHGPIPGMAYAEFLAGCVEFLLQNPGEIIVIQNRWDGVPPQCARPTDEQLSNYLYQALRSTQGGIVAGGLDDMLNLSIDALRTQKKRILVLKNVDSYSTYTDQANATLDGTSIIAEFEKLNGERQGGRPFTNLQCQATATNIPKVVAYTSITANSSNSCLLATKCICHSKTMPWIKKNAVDRLNPRKLLVIMDDFVDVGMCDLAMDLSIARLARV